MVAAMSRAAVFALLLSACTEGSAVTPTDAAADAARLDGTAVTDVSTGADRATDTATPTDATAAVDATRDAGSEPDDAGASVLLAIDYGMVDCAMVNAFSLNDGGARLNEVCDRGRTTMPRYVSLRTCAESFTTNAALVRQVADNGAYMNPSRHPFEGGGEPCSRFVTLYPIEQVRHALWCLRNPGRCNDDGSLR